MSDRLAISATLSVLMMSIFVLFGTGSALERAPADGLTTPARISAPQLPAVLARMLPIAH